MRTTWLFLRILETARRNSPSLEVNPWRAQRTAGNSRAGLRHSINLPQLLRSEEHTSELQSRSDLVCRLLLEKKKKKIQIATHYADAHYDRGKTRKKLKRTDDALRSYDLTLPCRPNFTAARLDKEPYPRATGD